jgi:pimeloyl-ACP methyl ester carboxylesterase
MIRPRNLATALCLALLWGCAQVGGGVTAVADAAPDVVEPDLPDAAAVDAPAPEVETTDAPGPEVPQADLPALDTPTEPSLWHEPCPVDTTETRYLDVGEVQLHVACRGAGPTIVFLHGFPEFHYSWNKVMDELASEFRLVAPDQRGYNLSDKPEDVASYAIHNLVGDILTLLPMVSADPVIVVAHDWGGPVGWAVAHTPDAHLRGFIATNGPHPLRLAWLIENDPAQEAASGYVDFFKLEGSEAYFTEAVLAEQFAGVLTDEELPIYMEAWFQPDAIKSGLNWYRANDLGLANIEAIMADYAPTVTVPTTVMWGLDDTALLPPNAEGLDAYVEDLVVETFEGVDHWIEHRIPAEIARAVREMDVRAPWPAP